MNAIDTGTLPTAADIEAAAARIAGVAVRTPLINAPVLDERLGARVFLKAEIFQRTGSFKFRGSYNKISSIPADRRAGGVVAYDEVAASRCALTTSTSVGTASTIRGPLPTTMAWNIRLRS